MTAERWPLCNLLFISCLLILNSQCQYAKSSPRNFEAVQSQEPTSIVSGHGLATTELESKDVINFIDKRPTDSARKGKLQAKLLPLAVTPQHYDLFLRPVINNGTKWPQYTAPGTVSILLDVHEPTDKISLHRSRDLEIVSVKLTKKSGNTELAISSQSYEESEATHTFELASSLTSVGKGQYEMVIQFTAVLLYQGSFPGVQKGMFVLDNSSPNGSIKQFVMTRFQSDGDWARRAFPSFDEPLFKATLNLSIARTADFNVLSNSLLAKTEEDPENPGWFIDHFEPTPKMSPYLVAFVVSDFNCLAADPSIYPSKPVQICGNAQDLADGLLDLTLNTTAHAMKLLESTFKFPYEHSKVDGVAAPGFSGGMENWGLATYDADWISFRSRKTKEEQRILNLELVIHELVHNWVGNLVTCKSWHHYWLNEGLTVYLTAMFLSKLCPEISPNLFFSGAVQGAFWEDLGVQTAVSGPTASSDEMIYHKGGAICRMLEEFMGKELLLEAIAEYLQRFAYKAVEQDDLFTVLEEFAQKEGRIASGHSIKEVLESWVMQPGHPLVRVERDTTDPTLIKLTQEVFQKKEGPDDSKLWVVPIYIASDKNPAMNGRIADLWFSTPSMETKLDIGPDSWYIFNADGVGFYHVLYSDELFDLILNQLSKNHTVISPASKAALIFDYFRFQNQGHVKLEKALSLTKFLIHELEQDVWYALFKAFPLTSALTSLPDFRAYWIPRIEKLLDYYSVEDLGESGSSVLFKSFLLQWSISLMSSVFTTKASAIVQEWKSSGQPVSLVRPDYWGPIYCGAVADKNSSQFDFLLKVYQERPGKIDDSEILSIFGALTCAQDPQVIRKLLDATLDEGLIKSPANAAFFYQSLTQNSVARGPLHKFWKERFDDLIEIENGQHVQSLADYFARSCYSETERDELLNILEEHRAQIANAEQLIESVKQSVKLNLDFLSTTGQQVLKWFAENK